MSMNTLNDQIQISRQHTFHNQVVLIDGFPGCGKTLFSSVVSSLKRVEMLKYPFEIEYYCSLYNLGKISLDAASTMIKMSADLQIYNSLQSRELNFRFSDISSVFNDAFPLRYFKRLFQKGDELVPARIERENPILHLATHRLLRNSEPVFTALNERLTYIEIVRHPLYMLKQEFLNMERLIANPRDFTVYFTREGKEYPEWAHGWEEKYNHSNNMDKTIYSYEYLMGKTEETKSKVLQSTKAKIITISFEQFVLEPQSFLDKILGTLKTEFTSKTPKVLKKQKVPRKKLADAPRLKIYERCGWVPPQAESEEKEFETRWRFAAEKASPEAMRSLRKLCEAYEIKYLGGIKNYNKG
jgi:hypothetical protein